ncbi:MAG: hypothetical protein ABWZ52_13825 [Acidimicrobiales bacterium]
MGREALLGQVATEVADLVARVERIVGPRPSLSRDVVSSVRRLVEDLEYPLTEEAAGRAIMTALYPYEDPPRDFWVSEAGQACARAIGYHREVVPFVQAGYILNVSRQRIYQLCELERLIRVDGAREGVTPKSLRYELRKHGRRPHRRG